MFDRVQQGQANAHAAKGLGGDNVMHHHAGLREPDRQRRAALNLKDDIAQQASLWALSDERGDAVLRQPVV